jgi:hypothetical protein
MHCPDCGYEVDDLAVFCPQCRHHFLEHDGPDPQEVLAGDPLFEQETTGFTPKELRHLEVELLQPSLFLALIVSAGLYFLVTPLQALSISMGGMGIVPGAGIALIAGIVAGLLFFYSARHSLKKFRSR